MLRHKDLKNITRIDIRYSEVPGTAQPGLGAKAAVANTGAVLVPGAVYDFPAATQAPESVSILAAGPQLRT